MNEQKICLAELMRGWQCNAHKPCQRHECTANKCRC